MQPYLQTTFKARLHSILYELQDYIFHNIKSKRKSVQHQYKQKRTTLIQAKASNTNISKSVQYNYMYKQKCTIKLVCLWHIYDMKSWIRIIELQMYFTLRTFS